MNATASPPDARPLLLRALEGAETPRRPLWLMRQAGRYLPEYRALRAGRGFEEMLSDPQAAAEVTLLPLARYPFDAAIVFADLMSPLGALGARFRFDPGPVLDAPLRSAAQIAALRDPHPEEIAPEVMDTLAGVRERLAPGTALLGFTGAPLTLAAYLVEGRGGRDFPHLRALAAADPAAFEGLLAKLAALAAAYAREQARAGAQAVQVFDSWAGLLAPEAWRRLVRPHLVSLLEAMGRAGIPRILFAQGAPHLAEEYAALPAECFSVDWRIDLGRLRERLGPGKALQGNLDPAILLAGPEAARRAAGELLARVPRRGHVVNLGHGLLPETPLESVQAMVDAVHGEAGAS